MGTEIKTWQIVEGKLQVLATSLRNEGRTEPYDLEPWIASNPSIIGDDICIIGTQVLSKSGPIDILGIDQSGNTVIVELKREKLPRECLAQAIDYASDVATWSAERLSEVCSKYWSKTLQEVFNDAFPDVDLEGVTLNSTQRIVLVGFSIESSLERMIEWLSDSDGVSINAIVLNYVKTTGGDELLTRTAVISEELEQARARKLKKFEIAMSDEPGTYEPTRLKQLLTDYLSRKRLTNQRIKNILLPACLKHKVLTRDQLKKEFIEVSGFDESEVGHCISTISSQLGMAKNDFLRQLVSYEYPRHHWEKDNFSIRDEFRDVMIRVLEELKHI